MKISDLKGDIKVNSSSGQGSSKQTSSSQQTQPNALSGFSTGVAKGELSTVRGLGQIGQGVLDQTAGRVVNAVQGKGFTPTTGGVGDIYRPQTQLGQKTTQALTPQGTPEKIGFGTEQAAEYLLPASKAAKAERVVDLLSKGISSPLGAATLRIAGKGAVQGLAAGGIKYAQSGGNVKDTANTALTAGALRSGLAVAGETARALHLPERFYQTIFKNSKQDMLAELKKDGIYELAQKNPQKYQELVSSGIIKPSPTGPPELNETLAEQALHRGLRGDFRGMANEVVGKTLETEQTLQQTVKGYTGTVSLKEPQFEKILRNISQRYEDVGFNEISDNALSLAREVKRTKGLVSAETALNIRRVLDKARLASSFEAPVEKLSLGQANLKTLADVARSRINSVPGVGPLMKDYSFYIDALESLAKESARRGNNQVLGLIDSIFLSGAISGQNPVGMTLGMAARKTFGSPQAMTGIGQAIQKGVTSPVTSGVLGAASNAIASELKPQQQQIQ